MFDNTLVTALLVDVDPTTVIKVAYVSFTALDVKKEDMCVRSMVNFYHLTEGCEATLNYLGLLNTNNDQAFHVASSHDGGTMMI